MSQKLYDDLKQVAGIQNTASLSPGEMWLLRNSDNTIPYKSVMVIGDSSDAQVRLADTLSNALLKLESDGISSVSMPVFRLDKLRQFEADIASGSPVDNSTRFTEEDLIKEHVDALRKFRVRSNGRLTQVNVMVTEAERKFGERLNRAIEEVLREPIMVAQDAKEDVAVLPSNIRVAPRIGDGR